MIDGIDIIFYSAHTKYTTTEWTHIAQSFVFIAHSHKRAITRSLIETMKCPHAVRFSGNMCGNMCLCVCALCFACHARALHRTIIIIVNAIPSKSRNNQADDNPSGLQRLSRSNVLDILHVQSIIYRVYVVHFHRSAMHYATSAVCFGLNGWLFVLVFGGNRGTSVHTTNSWGGWK